MSLTYQQLEDKLSCYIGGQLEAPVAARYIVEYLLYESSEAIPSVLNPTANGDQPILVEAVESTNASRNTTSRKIAVGKINEMLANMSLLSTVNKDDPHVSTCFNILAGELSKTFSLFPELCEELRTYDNIGDELKSILDSRPQDKPAEAQQAQHELPRALPPASDNSLVERQSDHLQTVDAKRGQDGSLPEAQNANRGLLLQTSPVLQEPINANHDQESVYREARNGNDRVLLVNRNNQQVKSCLISSSSQNDSIALFESYAYPESAENAAPFNPAQTLSDGFVDGSEQAENSEVLIRRLPLMAKECIPADIFPDLSVAHPTLGNQCDVRGIVSRLFDKKGDRYSAVIASTGTEMALIWDPEAQKLTQVRTPYFVKDGDKWLGNSLAFEEAKEPLRIDEVPVKAGSFIFLLTERAWKQLPHVATIKKGVKYVDASVALISEEFKVLQRTQPNAGLSAYQGCLEKMISNAINTTQQQWHEVTRRIKAEIEANRDKITVGDFEFVDERKQRVKVRQTQFDMDLQRYIKFRITQDNCPQEIRDANRLKSYASITRQLLKEDLEKFSISNIAKVAVQWAEPKKVRYVRKYVETNNSVYLTKAYHAGLATQDLQDTFNILTKESRYQPARLKTALTDVTVFLDNKYHNTLSFTALALTLLTWFAVAPIFFTPLIYGLFKRNLAITPQSREIVETTESEDKQIKALRRLIGGNTNKRKLPTADLEIFNGKRKLRKILVHEERDNSAVNGVVVGSENVASPAAKKKLFYSMSPRQKDEYELLRQAIRDKQAEINYESEQVVDRFSQRERGELQASLRAIHNG